MSLAVVEAHGSGPNDRVAQRCLTVQSSLRDDENLRTYRGLRPRLKSHRRYATKSTTSQRDKNPGPRLRANFHDLATQQIHDVAVVDLRLATLFSEHFDEPDGLERI